jgi:hypothetical protein
LKNHGIDDTASAILSYFVRHPQAADDLEGIARWRLAEELTHRVVEQTSRALEWLVNEELLEESAIPGGGKVYSLNADQIEKARKFLATRPKDRAEDDGPRS